MPQHHEYSASGAEKWMNCAGAIAMEEGIPDTDTVHSIRGTAAHHLGYVALSTKTHPRTYENRYIVCGERQEDGHTRTVEWFSDEPAPEGATEKAKFLVDATMAEAVTEYYEHINVLEKLGAVFLERQVEFGSRIGTPGAFGTADGIVIHHTGTAFTIVDYKNGHTVVEAELNKQEMLYALGALNDFIDFIDEKTLTHINLVIVQPNAGKIKTYICTKEELLAFQEEAKQAIVKAQEAKTTFEDVKHLKQGSAGRVNWESRYLNPSHKACQWCKAKPTCGALARDIAKDLPIERVPTTEGLPDLGELMDAALERLPSIPFEDLARFYGVINKHKLFIEAVEMRMLNEMLAGQPHKGYKIVKGRDKNRKWDDDDAVVKALKASRLRLDEMYQFKLKSPAQLEKYCKARPKVWKKLESHISRPEGELCVAPIDDRRPALNPFLRGANEDYINDLLGAI